MTEPLPCPFCGHVGLSHNEGSTFRWLSTECNGCGAQCGEERINTMTMERSAAIEQAKEAAIKAWNTRAAQPPQQAEPVAFYVYKPTLPRGNLGSVADGDLPWVYDQDPSSGYAARMRVYTTPPQRQWVGLTDEDFLGACKIADRGNYLVAFQRIQIKLKERNT